MDSFYPFTRRDHARARTPMLRNQVNGFILSIHPAGSRTGEDAHATRTCRCSRNLIWPVAFKRRWRLLGVMPNAFGGLVRAPELAARAKGKFEFRPEVADADRRWHAVRLDAMIGDLL